VRFISFIIGDTDLKPAGNELKLVRCSGGCKECEKVETDVKLQTRCNVCEIKF
jgi:hypothetical protein